jgi:branched-chain amino acid transport system permease protein
VIPLVGGLSGLFFAALFGYVTTKKAGTTFAMITLGIGELVAAMSLMFPGFFGGEGGVTTNRVYGGGFLGLKFGSQLEVYYLIAVYCFISTVLMFVFTLTPLGRMLNAVRDNPERVEFVGYSTQRVRYFSFIISGFFAGIGGALAAINFEIVNASDSLSAVRSGGYLLFTFLGGATFFFGPMIGAVLLVLASVLLSEVTKAWLLYLGLIFLFMVMYAPGGIASLIMMNVRVAAYRKLHRLWGWYAALAATAAVMLAGLAALIELVYHLQLEAGTGSKLRYLGLTLDTESAVSWLGAVVVAVVGTALLEWVRRRFAVEWGRVQSEIEEAMTFKEPDTAAPLGGKAAAREASLGAP